MLKCVNVASARINFHNECEGLLARHYSCMDSAISFVFVLKVILKKVFVNQF